MVKGSRMSDFGQGQSAAAASLRHPAARFLLSSAESGPDQAGGLPELWVAAVPRAAASQGPLSMLAGEQQLLEAAGGVLEEDRLARVAQLGRQAEQPLVVLLVPDLERVRLVCMSRGSKQKGHSV